MLKIKDLVSGYGSVQILNGANMKVDNQSIVALLGGNGTGKSTILKACSGIIRTWKGSINFNGEDIQNLPPHNIVEKGLVQVTQGKDVFPAMTVLENLLFSGSEISNDSLFKSVIKSKSQKKYEENLKDKAKNIMEDLNILHMADSYARELSGGQKKLLELARSIINEPEILLLDEPLAGVNPKLAEDILSLIKKLSNEGITILMVEHNIEAVMKISERIVVLAEGSLIADGNPNEIRTDRNVIEAYLGKDND